MFLANAYKLLQASLSVDLAPGLSDVDVAPAAASSVAVAAVLDRSAE